MTDLKHGMALAPHEAISLLEYAGKHELAQQVREARQKLPIGSFLVRTHPDKIEIVTGPMERDVDRVVARERPARRLPPMALLATIAMLGASSGMPPPRTALDPIEPAPPRLPEPAPTTAAATVKRTSTQLSRQKRRRAAQRKGRNRG